MGAFNWVVVEGSCPACGETSRMRCQTHVASSFSGDRRGRFHDREYELGQPMAWWPSTQPEFATWRANGMTSETGSSVDEEACHATCPPCGAELFVVLRFREAVPESVLAIGREADWPAGYLK